jgi:hypothetical protein
MKTCAIFLLMWLSAGLSAQTGKGATPLATQNATPNTQNSTRAVVVGISDYQSIQIPDLKFADKDAQAFADWLQSPAGGSVPADNIQLLTNDKATNSAVILALHGLLRTAEPGNQAIIYFSGHGDVESVLRGQPGFLLTYDTPPSVYMAGAVDLRQLQDIVSTLAEKQVKIILVTDACHAGKLAGNLNNGTQATAMSLSQRFANEVKIMSCQPDEFSVEGEQWGGGRGVFSYYLLKALTGLADKNSDGTVNLFETNRYLQDIVPAQTSATQMPFTVGDLQATLAWVDAPSLALLREQEAHGEQSLEKVGIKGLEEEVLAKTDSATRRQYADFKNALAAHYLLEPAERCAWDLYQKLAANPKMEPLRWVMQRNLAVALLDEVQQALNALLDNDPYEANTWKANPAKYRDYPEYLQKAMDLLGDKHLMYRSLLAKKYYFEGYNLAKNIADFNDQPAVRDTFKAAAKAKYLESLAIEPDAAYPCYAVGNLYYLQVPIQTDSLLVWMQKAVDRSPAWLLPYLDAAEEINSEFNDAPRAESWLLKAKAYHPESYLLQIRLAWLNQWENDPEAANAICRELIAQRPDLPDAWCTLTETQRVMQNDWVAAKISAQEALKCNPSYPWARLAYADCLAMTQPDSAVSYCTNWLREDPLDPGAKLTMIRALIALNRLEEAETWIEESQREGIGHINFQMGYQSAKGRIRLLQGRLAETEVALQKSLDLDNTQQADQIEIFALLGEVKTRQHKPGEAEAFFKKAVDFPYKWDENRFKPEAHFLYGRFLLHQNRTAEAQVQFETALKISPKTWHYPLGMALLAAKNGQKTAALDWLEKALDSFYFDETAIEEELLFEKLRNTKRFKTLLAKHFPETTK